MSAYRKMLSDITMPPVAGLFKVIPTQSKPTIAKWAADYAQKRMLPLWVKYYPEDKRPQAALAAACEMIRGTIRWKDLNPRIEDCLSAAKEAEHEPVPRGAARAIAQCSSTIHSASHSIGLALYGALAVAYEERGVDAPWSELEQCAACECERMLAAFRAVMVPDERHPANINWKC
jgi:hypothetical protein